MEDKNGWLKKKIKKCASVNSQVFSVNIHSGGNNLSVRFELEPESDVN